MGGVQRCTNICQNYLCRKYTFRDLALNIQVWKSLTFFPSFSPLPYHSHIHWLDFIVQLCKEEKKKEESECSTYLSAFFLVCWPKLTAFFVFPSLSEVYHNVLKKKSQDIFPRFWCPLILKFILLSLFLIYFFPHFLKIKFQEAEMHVSSQSVSNLFFTRILTLQALSKIHITGFSLKGRTLIQSSQPPTLDLKGH